VAALLAAANCDDDFELVAVAQTLLGEQAARHDLAVALQSHALVTERHGLK